MNSNRIMIVAAGRHQAPLIRKAKAMGYEVLATDSSGDAPSLPLADHRAIVNARDVDGLVKVATTYQPKAILSEQTDVAVPAVARVAELLGLPGIGYRTAIMATDKWEMREACRRAGLPMPKYRLATSSEEAMIAAQDIGLPVVIKPTDNQSSRGVTKVSDIALLPDAVRRAASASQSGRIIVEELMVGVESSVESFVIGDSVTVLGISEKIKCAPPYSFDLQLIYPAAFSPELTDEIKILNRGVIDALGIRMGFAHAEIMITSQGPRLIEIAARGCGARIATNLLPELTGVDLLELRLRQALGEVVQMPKVRTDLFGICRFFDFKPGTVRNVGSKQEAASIDGVVHLDFELNVGDCLQSVVSGDQRPGFVLAKANSRARAIEIADEVTRVLAVDMV